jgi:hypothetical protein
LFVFDISLGGEKGARNGEENGRKAKNVLPGTHFAFMYT